MKTYWKMTNGESDMKLYKDNSGYYFLEVNNQNGWDYHVITSGLDPEFEIWNILNCYKITFGDFNHDIYFLNKVTKFIYDIFGLEYKFKFNK